MILYVEVAWYLSIHRHPPVKRFVSRNDHDKCGVAQLFKILHRNGMMLTALRFIADMLLAPGRAWQRHEDRIHAERRTRGLCVICGKEYVHPDDPHCWGCDTNGP